jgi:hypothetical protein
MHHHTLHHRYYLLVVVSWAVRQMMIPMVELVASLLNHDSVISTSICCNYGLPLINSSLIWSGNWVGQLLRTGIITWIVWSWIAYDSYLFRIHIMSHYFYLVQWNRHVCYIGQWFIVQAESVADIPCSQLLSVRYRWARLVLFINKTKTACLDAPYFAFVIVERVIVVLFISLTVLLQVHVSATQLMSSPKPCCVLRN